MKAAAWQQHSSEIARISAGEKNQKKKSISGINGETKWRKAWRKISA